MKFPESEKVAKQLLMIAAWLLPALLIWSLLWLPRELAVTSAFGEVVLAGKLGLAASVKLEAIHAVEAARRLAPVYESTALGAAWLS
jgi:hypothetical protein